MRRLVAYGGDVGFPLVPGRFRYLDGLFEPVQCAQSWPLHQIGEHNEHGSAQRGLGMSPYIVPPWFVMTLHLTE
jgi:hypothetical protein